MQYALFEFVMLYAIFSYALCMFVAEDSVWALQEERVLVRSFLCLYAFLFSGLDPCTHVADLLVVVGWGQVVHAIMVQVPEVRDHSLGHRYSLVIIEMNLLTQDELPPVFVSVVGGPANLPLPHGGAEDPLSAGSPVILAVVHVPAKPVELWRVLCLLVLLLTL